MPLPHRFTVCLFALTTLLPACTTPPSVSPLLDVVDKALTQEADCLQADQAREDARLAQARAALDAGLADDLTEHPAPQTPWLLDEAHAYARAREELMHQEMTTRNELTRRADNLATARQAQARARAILDQQDRLLTQALQGLRLWNLPPVTTQP